MSESNSGKFKPYTNRLNFKNKQCGKIILISSQSNNIFLDKFFLKEKKPDQQEINKQYFENLHENLEKKSQQILQQQRSPNWGRSKKSFFQQKEMYMDQISTQQELSFRQEEQIYRSVNHQKWKSQQHQKIPSIIKLDQANKNINKKFRTSGSNLQFNDQKIQSKIKNLSIYSQTIQLSIKSDNKLEEQKLSQTQEILQLKKEQNEFSNIYNELLIKLTAQSNKTENYKNKCNDLENKFMKICEEKKRNEKVHSSQQLELMKNYNANLEINQKQIGDLTIQIDNQKKENYLLKQENERLLNLQEEQSLKYNQSIKEIQQLKLELQQTKDQYLVEQQNFQQQQQQLQELNSKHIEDLIINNNQSICQMQQMKQELQQTKDQLTQEQLKFQQQYQQQFQEIKTKDDQCNSLKFKLNQQELDILALKDKLNQYQVNQGYQENRLQNEYRKLMEQNQNVINALQAEKTQLLNDLIICKNELQGSDNQIQHQMKLLQEYHSKNEELQNRVKKYEVYFFDIQIKVITPLNQEGIKITVKQGFTLLDLFNYVSFKCYYNYSQELTSINIIEKRCNYRSNLWNQRLVDIFSGGELLKCQMIEFQTV